MIEEYSFGRIRVGGKVFTRDIVIFPGRIKESWWRKEGHSLQLADLEDVFKEKPKTLVVGCGHDGVMKVMPEVREYCRENGIELIELWTADAVKRYNGIAGPGVIGAFHLTC